MQAADRWCRLVDADFSCSQFPQAELGDFGTLTHLKSSQLRAELSYSSANRIDAPLQHDSHQTFTLHVPNNTNRSQCKRNSPAISLSIMPVKGNTLRWDSDLPVTGMTVVHRMQTDTYCMAWSVRRQQPWTLSCTRPRHRRAIRHTERFVNP